MKAGTPRTPELAGVVAELVRVFLECIADEDQRLHLEELGLASSVGENLPELSVAHAAVDSLHQSG